MRGRSCTAPGSLSLWSGLRAHDSFGDPAMAPITAGGVIALRTNVVARSY